MLSSLLATWQDMLVTVIALAAAAVVVWRTVGNWREGAPGQASGCDHCALKDGEMGR